MLKLFDKYSLKARIAPFVILILPLFIGVFSWMPLNISIQFGSIGIIVIISFSILMSQISRDAGKSKEMQLWGKWGGPPTTRFLRHSNNEYNKILKGKCHDKINKVLKGIKAPSSVEEANNPSHADEIYEAFTKLIISKTRDNKKYPLVFSELVNYGFIRNLWGLKVFGIIFSILGSLSSIIHIITIIHISNFAYLHISAICSLLSLFFIIIWVFWVTEKRIKLIANAYAERLLELYDEI